MTGHKTTGHKTTGRKSRVALVSFTMIWLWSLGTATAQTIPADAETSLANTTQTAASSGLSSDQIHTVVAEHRLEVRSCVSGDGLGLPTRLDMVVDFLIGADGRVVRATLYESNAGNEDVEACVSQRLQ